MPRREPTIQSAANSRVAGEPEPVGKRPGPPVARPGASAAEGVAEGLQESGNVCRWRQLLSFRSLTSVMISCAFHLTLILILSMMMAFIPGARRRSLVVTSKMTDGVSSEDLDVARVIVPEPAMTDASLTSMSAKAQSDLQMPREELLRGETPLEPLSSDPVKMRRADALRSGTNTSGGGLDARSGRLKALMLEKGGGTPESEEAVRLGLVWLAKHQWQDGGWRLDLSGGPCGGRCGNSGKVATSTGATGLALLSFLGAGHTHMSGDYQDQVDRGLEYLRSRIVQTPHGADLQEGTMYAHGIATMALCEAYAMTQDHSLRQSARDAMDFICFAQHSKGGWRYYPGQPGDTTVFGWQMMALKSAAMAGLRVPSSVITKGERFLDSVQTSKGAYYGYLNRGKDPGPTAIGLLIRMYSGWNRNDARLRSGVEYLAAAGPSQHDMYFNYYATQVIHHYGGPEWPAWNRKMRDYLIETQATRGHELGSWFFSDEHGSDGGRLYTTAMCIMILEVYYRHMPLYGTMAVEDGWR